MALATAPLSWYGWAWLAFAPLWGLCRKATWRSRLLYGALWGFGYYGGALFWITGIHPMTWMGVPWLASLGIALVCWLLITLWGTAIAALWALLWPLVSPPFLLGRWCAGVTLWCALESLWQLGPLWWSSLAYTQSPDNLWILHWGRLSGPTVVTALIVGVNGLIAEAVLALRSTESAPSSPPAPSRRGGFQTHPYPVAENFRQSIDKAALASTKPQTIAKTDDWWAMPTLRDVRIEFLTAIKALSTILMSLRPTSSFWRLVISGMGLLGITIGGGYALMQWPEAAHTYPTFRVGIIQGNIPNEIKLYPEGWRRAIAGYTEGYNELAAQGVDVVATPETALPFVWSILVEKQHPFYHAVQRQQVPVWVGAFGQEGAALTNSLFSITATGKTLSRYDKVKLVPLGEYIPFAALLGQVIRRLSPLDAQLAAGTVHQTLATPFGPAIVGICYESAFPEHFRRQAAQGGEFIVTASNNAHYSAVMPAQHHALDVMRAIETDRWAIRATNTGYSAIVNPHGQSQWRSEMDVYALHSATVERRRRKTLYVRWGDWLIWVLVIGSGLMYSWPRWIAK
ncbi:MAG: apolipoprotein N-acyltransferase [Spirulinaceae cyanobacterium]